MKTAPYELTPEDHLSPDGKQERVTDPKKAAHMGHAAHLAFIHAQTADLAHRMMIAGSQEGEAPHDTARSILKEARERAAKRMYDAGKIDGLDYDGRPLEFGMAGHHSKFTEGFDQDMIVAAEARFLADVSVNNGVTVEELEPSPNITDRDQHMEDQANDAGNRYDRVMKNLSRYKDVDIS